MSKYTTELRFICEMESGLKNSVGYTQVESVISSAREKIFDFSYPIFDIAYKSVLESKILKHFYTREICAETYALWKLWLNDKMNVIMPYFNQLYKSALLEFNPLYDVDVVRKHTGTNESNNTSTSSSTSSGSTNTNGTSYNIFSDTPQGALTGVENETYLTNATKDKNNSTTTQQINGTEKSENNGNTVENYLERVRGKQGSSSFSKMLTEYRDTFLNIDEQVLDELEELFMQLW